MYFKNASKSVANHREERIGMDDTIVRVLDKTKNFSIVSNEVPRRNDLSARAKGLYFYLMTLPDDWIIHKGELYSHFTEGRDALDNAFKELVTLGYITSKVVKEKGRFVSFTYTIYETSQKPVTGNPVPEKPKAENPYTENPQLPNIDSLLKTDELNTDNKSGEEEFSENALKLASLLFSLHKELIDEKYFVSETNIRSWAKDIEKIQRLDHRENEDIEKAIVWIKHNDFWASNIMSGKKLREKFPTIIAQMQRGSGGQKQELKVFSRTELLDIPEA